MDGFARFLGYLVIAAGVLFVLIVLGERSKEKERLRTAFHLILFRLQCRSLYQESADEQARTALKHWAYWPPEMLDASQEAFDKWVVKEWSSEDRALYALARRELVHYGPTIRWDAGEIRSLRRATFEPYHELHS